MSSTPKKGSNPGCFAYGCLIATVIFCIIIGSVWFFGLRSMRAAVVRYTAQNVEQLEFVAIDSSALESAGPKLAQLRTAANDGASATVEFSQQELQALIGSSEWRDWVRVNLEGNEAKLWFSFPLAALGDWSAASFLVGDIRERALVGSAKCRIEFRQGKPQMSFSELNLNKEVLEDLPRGHAADWIIGAISDALRDPEFKAPIFATLKSIRDVTLRNGRLVVSVGKGASGDS
jgi:hypothetical protein